MNALSPEESAALLAALVPLNDLAALAVSGGPDSMALALCAKRAGWPCRAFIVDHKLRLESSSEAAQVKAELVQMGIEAEILVWTHGDISRRVHVEARRARYDLLAEACRRHGLRHLLLAHHRDDQAETILMRLAKGSGIEGLGGMKPISDYDGISLIRPFLSIPKARLVATCEAAGLSFVRDPSNEKEKYARGRLRKVSDALAEEGFTAERLLDLGERASEAATAIDFYAKAFLRKNAILTLGGAIEMILAGLEDLPQAVALKVFSLCFLTLHPTNYAPERKLLLAFYAAMKTGTARTLHGVMIHRTETKMIFAREWAAIIDVREFEPGETVLWDGRWLVSCESKDGMIRSLGFQPKEVLDKLAPGLRQAVPQGRVRATLPALWRKEDLISAPSFSQKNQSLLKILPQKPLWM